MVKLVLLFSIVLFFQEIFAQRSFPPETKNNRYPLVSEYNNPLPFQSASGKKSLSLMSYALNDSIRINSSDNSGRRGFQENLNDFYPVNDIDSTTVVFISLLLFVYGVYVRRKCLD